MSDILREVEEDIRREQFKQLWDKYGLFVMGVALAIILATAAIVGWRAYTKSQNEKLSAQYEAVVAAAETQAAPDAAKAFEAFVKESKGGYAIIAQMRQAAALNDAGDDKGAIAIYDTLAASSSAPQIMRELAQLKAGLILVDTASYDDVKARLTPLVSEKGTWRNLAREAIGLSAFKAGAFADADKLFAAIIEDADSSSGLRDRAHVMQAMIAPMLPKTPAQQESKQAAPAATTPSAKPE